MARAEVGSRRLGDVIRLTFDQVLDAERTGRFDLVTLSAVERAYLSDRLRILLRDEFDLPHGPGVLPMSIDGIGVDVVFEPTGWQLPDVISTAVYLVIPASDEAATFSLGLLRCHNDEGQAMLGSALSEADLARVAWVWRDHTMPTNILRSLPAHHVQAIFALSGKGNGQARINELFSRINGQIIPRRLITTAAHQDDPTRRARTARDALQQYGIVILGHEKPHQQIAKEFGLPVPKKGEWVSVRVVRATPQRQSADRAFVTFGGGNWMRALDDEPTEHGPEDYSPRKSTPAGNELNDLVDGGVGRVALPDDDE